ncbi:acyltransferase [Actinocatenispora thailandica]|uniref:Acyltransferase n=1 Tax=Actinocatenispora thailandica TaxID=227318 RepID=A0A7R7DK22_9ACTN|nr:acyltransferase family protein [Actinocatenispora thailandica]BCJ33160.1 acyltransferase [Actinocatenispora thailandica]
MALLTSVPAKTPGHGAAPAAAGRDRFVDAIRAFGTIAVLLLHWLIPVVGWDGQRLAIGNALSAGQGWLVTWPLQVIPLMFFAAGAAAWCSRGDATAPVPFLRRRLGRLLPPVIVFVLVWAMVLAPAALALGVPAAAVARGASIAPQLLWFVAVYLLLSLATPLLLRAYHRYGLGLVLPLAGAAVAVDAARFLLGGPSWLGYLNVLFVWAVPYLLGFGYADGRFRNVPRRALVAVAAASVLVLALLVAAGPYPASMVGLPGDTMSNMNPPTICLLLVTGFQVPIALLARGPVLRALRYRPVGRAVGFVQARSMTLYLWHLTAMFVLVGVVLFGLHRQLPVAWSAGWWATRPLWYGVLIALTAVLVRVFGRVELRAPRPPRSARALAGYTGIGCLFAALLLVITTGTMATGPFGPQTVALLLGALGATLLVLSRRPAAAPAGGRNLRP